MIIINDHHEQMTMGSKRFTDAVAAALRPHLKDFLDKEQLDDFEGEVLHVALWWDRYSQEQFMRVFEIVAGLADMGNLEWERKILIELMQKDPRFMADKP